jgi:hypothetical protein
MPSKWIKAPFKNGMHYLSGNAASAEGAIAAGCRFNAGYPITPSSEIMERMWYLCICLSKRSHPNGLGGGDMTEKEIPVLSTGYEAKKFFSLHNKCIVLYCISNYFKGGIFGADKGCTYNLHQRRASRGFKEVIRKDQGSSVCLCEGSFGYALGEIFRSIEN